MTTPAIEKASCQLDQYVPLLGAAEIDELRTLAKQLEGSAVEMVSSTAVGGGVAEILTRILPLMRELGLVARWQVMEGGPGFFEVIRASHHAMHESAYQVRNRDFELFVDYNQRNRQRLALDARSVVIHDPQP